MKLSKNDLLIVSVIFVSLMNANNVVASSEDESSSEDGRSKVTICHFPPGNQSNYQKITIRVNALTAHARHQDYKANGNDCPKVNDSASSLSQFTSISTLLKNLNIVSLTNFTGFSGQDSWREVTIPATVEDPIKKAKAAEKALANKS